MKRIFVILIIVLFAIPFASIVNIKEAEAETYHIRIRTYYKEHHVGNNESSNVCYIQYLGSHNSTTTHWWHANGSTDIKYTTVVYHEFNSAMCNGGGQWG